MMHATVGYFYWVHPWMGHDVAGIAAWSINYSFYSKCTVGAAGKGRTG
jgi:hypothetical protein